MLIKKIKKDNLIYTNIEDKTVVDGQEIWNIPQDLKEFKTMAIDTINWQIGDSVKNALGKSQTNLSASNAKGIALLAKVISSLNPNLDNLTELEKDSWNKLVILAENGYADSQMLNTSITSVMEYIQKGTGKITRVVSAKTHEEVIGILNEEW